jgi:hypothetical protein
LPPPQPKKPEGDCTKARHAELQAEVDKNCQPPTGATKCKYAQRGEIPCEYYKDMVKKFAECWEARKTINNECYGGGDDGHKEQAENARKGAERCQKIYEWCLEREARIAAIRRGEDPGDWSSSQTSQEPGGN